MVPAGEPVAGDEALFELRFSPSVRLVSAVRRFVSEFYGEVLGDAEIVDGIAMATHELLENTVAYSIDGKSELDIVVRRGKTHTVIQVMASNRATPDRLEMARMALDLVIQAPDPETQYLELVRRAATRRDGGSGLGLGRIRAETPLTLEYSVEGDRLSVHVHGRFPAPPAEKQTPSEVQR
jgi:hypothetical protein